MKPAGIIIGESKIQVLGFADDLSILSSSLNDTKRAVQVLKKTADKVGLKINRQNKDNETFRE